MSEAALMSEGRRLCLLLLGAMSAGLERRPPLLALPVCLSPCPPLGAALLTALVAESGLAQASTAFLGTL